MTNLSLAVSRRPQLITCEQLADFISPCDFRIIHFGFPLFQDCTATRRILSNIDIDDSQPSGPIKINSYHDTFVI
jgi:hypothetical protein